MTTDRHSPLVSILIPVYNREKLVGSCIRSACEQTISDIEIIVVDNASTDNTLEVCRKLAEQDSRIKVFSNSSNLGPVRNWQCCIAEARGTYGKILFSDDLMAPEFLAKTIPYLEQDDVGFVFSSVVVGSVPFEGATENQFTGQSGIFDSNRYISMSLFSGDLPVSPGAALFRVGDLKNALLLDIPSPTINDFQKHGAGPDLLVYLLIAVRYPLVAYLHEPLSFFRAHGGSITVSKEKSSLNQCYRQARLWFAEQHLDEKWLKRLYLYEWKRECNETEKWSLPQSIVSRYSGKKLKFTLFDILFGVLMAKLVKKGALLLPCS